MHVEYFDPLQLSLNVVTLNQLSLSFSATLKMVVSSKAEQVSEVHVVTGGGGYVGLRLGRKLAEQGHQVMLFDVRKPVEKLPSNVQFVTVSITDMILFSMIYFGISLFTNTSLVI